MAKEFTGIWIPREIMELKNINLTQKVLLSMIAALSKNKKCEASNGYLSSVLGIGKPNISRNIGTLCTKKYIGVTFEDMGIYRKVYRVLTIQYRGGIPKSIPNSIIDNIEDSNSIVLKPDLPSGNGFEVKYKYFINLFNQTAKETAGAERQFRGDEKSKRQFKARLKEGYKSEDFVKAIKNLYSNPNHRDNGFNHATPELITRAEKFVMYLNAKY